MYTRDMKLPPQQLVKNGKAVFGTFVGAPETFSIRGVKAPFGGMHFPRFITNFRIKSRLSYTFVTENFAGNIDFFDAKLFGYVELVLWDRQTCKKLAYRSFIGPRRRLVPKNLAKASCSNLSRSRKIKVNWDRAKDMLRISLAIKGDSARPGINGNFISHFSGSQTAETCSVMPWPRPNRCSAAYHFSSRMEGRLSLCYKKEPEQTEITASGLAFMDINRTLYKFHTQTEYVTGIGMADGVPVTFRLAQMQEDAVQSDEYNENMLYIQNAVTPLPPVLITHPYGIEKKWIIQDTEGMVDLEFDPLSVHTRSISALVVKSKYYILYGSFEGTILDKNGTKYSLKGFSGTAKQQDIRI